jgi:ACS family tartrate transporter-like MFS transporter
MLGLYGLGFWIPTVLASRGIAMTHLGWAAALPYLAAIVGMVLWSRSSDRRRERRAHLSVAYLAAAAGFLIAAFAPNAPVAIFGFGLAAIGILSAMPAHWSQRTSRSLIPSATLAAFSDLWSWGGFAKPHTATLQGSLRLPRASASALSAHSSCANRKFLVRNGR